MKLTTNTDLADLLERRPFQKKFVATLDLAFEILLSPNGKKYIYANEFYEVVGRPNQKSGYYDILSSLFHDVDYYRVSREGVPGNPYAKAVNEARLEKWLSLGNVQSDALRVEIPDLKAKALARGWSFETPVRRAEMHRKNHRVYGWWVTLKSSVRKRLFLETHPEMWDYDIQAAKPTLLLQEFARARETAPWRHRSASNVSAWSDLVEDRTKVRRRLMTEADLTTDDAKEVINVLLQGGHASPGGGAIVETIGKSRARALMESETYRALQADFAFAWDFYFKHMPGAQGLTRGEFMSRFYNALEDKVMTAIEDEVSGWFVHDGFFSHVRQDKDRLEDIIKSKTGLEVKLEEEHYTNSACAARLVPAAYYCLHISAG
jgi:hypothetical protein